MADCHNKRDQERNATLITSTWLDHLIDANPDIGEGANLFDAAFKYRNKLRPG